MDTLTARVYAQVRRQFWHRRHLALTPATHLQEDLDADTLDLAQLSIRLEYALRVDVPDADWPRWHTLADVLTTLRAATAHHGAPAGPAWQLAARPACPGPEQKP